MDTPIPEFLAEAANRRVSDIFIIAGRPLAEKIDGHLLDRGDRLMPDQTENLLRTIYGLAENRDISRLMETGDDDFSFSIPGVSRFRVNAYKQRGSLAAVIRVIAFRLPDPAELSIPEDVMSVSDYTRGMVLVTGSAGSGKSTTIASIIDYINENKCVHILTLEDPIEYVHTHKNAIVNQREVGIDVASYDEGLKLAIREDVDVIQVGRMSEPDTVKAVIKAAKAGSFVIAAVDVAGTKDIIQSIIDEFPPSEKEKINTQLKEVLKMVVSQKLIQQDKDGIKASFEILKIN